MYQQPEYEHPLQQPVYSVYPMQPMNWMVPNNGECRFTDQQGPPHLSILDIARQEAPVPPSLQWDPAVVTMKKPMEEQWYGAMRYPEYSYYASENASRTACSSPQGACDGAPFFGSVYSSGDCGSTSTSTSTSTSSSSSAQPSPVQDNMEFTQQQSQSIFPSPPTGHYTSALPGNLLDQPARNPAAVGASDARPFPCYACTRSFARKHDLQRHIRVHTGDKPYSCSCCKKAFARTDALKRHLRMEEVCRNSPQVQTARGIPKKRNKHL